MWRWLLQVEPMGRSLKVYAPIVLLEKLVIFGRIVLLTWLLGQFHYGVWALGVMVFGILAPAATLGSNESVARYVSFYQVRGRLREFHRKATLGIALVASGTLVAGLAGSGLIGRLLATSASAGVRLSAEGRHYVALLGVANGVVMALYHNLHSCIRALRTFRLLAAMDVCFTVLFTALALAAAGWLETGYMVLVAHALSLTVLLVLGGYAAHRGVLVHDGRGHVAGEILPDVEEPPLLPQDLRSGEGAQEGAAEEAPVLGRLLGFGFVAMVAAMLWNVGNQVSGWFVNRYHGSEALGLYAPLRQLCQPAWILSGIVWGLVFSHVANHWESNLRDAALRMLNVTYKAVVVALMTLTVLILLAAPLWSRLLREPFRRNLHLLPGLLMFFQCSANLGMVSIAAKLRERPAVIVAIVATAVAVNVVLAARWVPGAGTRGAADAAGIGMLSACGVGVVYLLVTRFRAHPAAHVLAVAPALLLLPAGVVVIAWALFLAAAATTPLVFSRWEKRELLKYARNLIDRRRPG